MRFISIVLVGKKPSFLIVANVRFCLGAAWDVGRSKTDVQNSGRHFTAGCTALWSCFCMKTLSDLRVAVPSRFDARANHREYAVVSL